LPKGWGCSMEKVFVIDANVLISALIKGEFTLQLIYFLKNSGYKLVSPEAVLEEIKENKEKILKCSGFSWEEIEFILKVLGLAIEFVPKEKFEEYLKKAKKICSDKDDSPYVALSLTFAKAPIWSNDKELKEDCKKEGIKVLSTDEVKLLVI